MIHHREASDSPGLETPSGFILAAIVRVIVLPILALGFICWVLTMGASLAIASAFEFLNFAVRGTRSSHGFLFPAGDGPRRDAELGRPELIE